MLMLNYKYWHAAAAAKAAGNKPRSSRCPLLFSDGPQTWDEQINYGDRGGGESTKMTNVHVDEVLFELWQQSSLCEVLISSTLLNKNLHCRHSQHSQCVRKICKRRVKDLMIWMRSRCSWRRWTSGSSWCWSTRSSSSSSRPSGSSRPAAVWTSRRLQIA